MVITDLKTTHIMKHIIRVLIIVQALSLSVHAQTPVLDWAFSVESEGAPVGYTGNGHHMALYGEYLYVVGTFAGTADFDPGPGVTQLTSYGYFDIFIQKLDTNGNFIWVRQIGGPKDDGATIAGPPYNGYPNVIGMSLKITDQGALILAGTFTDSIDCDPSPISSYWLQSGANNLTACFIAKLSEDGELIWAKRSASASSKVYSSDLDSQGNIYLAGSFSFWNPVDFDPSPTGTHFRESEGYDYFIQKLNPEGELEWVIQYETTVNGDGTFLEIDSLDNIIAVGQFYGTVDFDPGPDEYLLIEQNPNGNATATFICKLSSDGTFIWARVIQSGNVSGYQSLQIDDFQNIYLSQVFYGSIDVDPTEELFMITTESSLFGTFILKLDKEGNFKWVRTISSASPTAIHVDSQTIFLTGRYDGEVDFDPGIDIQTFSGPDDGFVLALDTNGQFRWAHVFSTQLIGTRAIKGDNGSIYGTGFSHFDVFDCDPGLSVAPLGPEIFVFKWLDYQLPVGIPQSIASDMESALTVYPNPTTDMVSINPIAPFELEVKILSAAGQLCSTQVFRANEQVRLELGNSPGMYHVFVVFPDRTESFQVVKE